jgi:hypothetical protein
MLLREIVSVFRIRTKAFTRRKSLPDLLEYFKDKIPIPWDHYYIENELVSKIIPTTLEASNDIVSGEQDTHERVRQRDVDENHNHHKV